MKVSRKFLQFHMLLLSQRNILSVFVWSVFVQETQANGVLVRSRRANMFLLEELLQGNLERECFEELCNYEEAREYFEDKEKTMAFWTVYYDGDQCKSNPCLNGGNCTDRVGGFYCLCTPPYSGPLCMSMIASIQITMTMTLPFFSWPNL
uniref:coagulation factor Xa n=1 Tax=Echeneis naucrates TaxID=173247 RepID=A0A665TVQ0_ECHNA